jgi:hypothetical protein
VVGVLRISVSANAESVEAVVIMNIKYYSSRNGKKEISIEDLHSRVVSLFNHFHSANYFEQKLGLAKNDNAELVSNLAHFHVGSKEFFPFPLSSWSEVNMSEENIFDTLEFLFHHISKPIEDSIYTGTYSISEGQNEFVKKTNIILNDYGVGFEITLNGAILAIGNDELKEILNTEIIEYDEVLVDSRVRNAILMWRNRELSFDVRKAAIHELADVFEWLKNNKKLETFINNEDDKAIFYIANKFAIRHHNSKQHTNYDKEIWYQWMFHFYLATYHAAIKLLKKNNIP